MWRDISVMLLPFACPVLLVMRAPSRGSASRSNSGTREFSNVGLLCCRGGIPLPLDSAHPYLYFSFRGKVET